MTKSTNIIFLDKIRFDLYSEEQNKIYSFDLSTFSQNLEIINKQEFEEQIKNFVLNYKISPGGIIIILSENILFVKGLPPDSDINQDDGQEQKFVNSVPFEHVSVKTYPIEGGKLLVAANKDFYSAIKSGFEKNGFTVNIVAPIYSAGITINPDTNLDENIGKALLKNEEQLRSSGLEVLVEKKAENSPMITTGKPEKKRLVRLLGVFGLLIVVFVAVLANSLLNPDVPIPKKNSTTTPNITPTINNVNVEITSSSAVVTIENMKIKILRPETATVSGALTRDKLIAAGFKNVAQEVIMSTSSSTIIVFKNSVSSDLRTLIINAISQIANNVVIQETQNSEADVSIFLVR